MTVPSLSNTNTGAVQYRIGKIIGDAQLASIKISTGERIVKAYEDAAGLAIGTGLDTNVQILRAALTSTQQAISVLNIADGGASSIVNVIKRLSQLQIMSLSGSATDEDRKLIEIEAAEQLKEIQRISTSTDFNGRKLIDGSIAAGNDFVISITGTEAKSSLKATMLDAPAAGTFTDMEIGGVEMSVTQGTGTTAAVGAVGTYESKTLEVSGPTGGTLADGNTIKIKTGTTGELTITVDGTIKRPAPSTASIIVGGNTQIRADAADAKTITVYLKDDATPPATVSPAPTFADIVTAITTGGTDGAPITTNLGTDVKIGKNDAGNLTFTLEHGDLADADAIDRTGATPKPQTAYSLSTDTNPSNGFEAGAEGSTLSINAVADTALLGEIIGSDKKIKITMGTGATAENVAAKVAEIISDPSKVTSVSQYLTAKLQLMSAEVDSADKKNVKISSKQTGVAGMLLAKVGNTLYTSKYDEASSTTGSLGVSNVKVYGSAAGLNKEGDATSKVASTGWQTLGNTALKVDNTIEFAGRVMKLVNSLTSSDAKDEIEVGKNDVLTAKNIVYTLQNSNDPAFENFNYEYQQNDQQENQIRISSKGASPELNGMKFVIPDPASTTALPKSPLADFELTGAKAEIVNVSTITDNPDFKGKIDQITAESKGDTVGLRITVGKFEYEGSIKKDLLNSDITKPLLFKSNSADHGGYFRITLGKENKYDVTDQTSANAFAKSLQTAFRDITFYQDRGVDSFKPEGSMIEGTVATYASQKFDKLSVTSVTVDQAQLDPNTNKVIGQISIKLDDGREFSTKYNDLKDLQNNPIGKIYKQVSIGQQVILKRKIDNDDDSTTYEQITLHFGKDVDFTEASQAKNLQDALTHAFQADHRAMDFQVGASSDQVISIALGSTQVKALGLENVDLSTEQGARDAGPKIEWAKNYMIAYRSEIGALQSRFNYAADGIATSIENMDAARSTFLDADITEEAKNFSVANAELAASIAVDAQMLQIPNALLKLIGA